MKRLQTRAAAAALSALLLASPACALAAETAPLTLNTQQDATVQTSRKDLGQLENFGHRRAYRGVSASDQWLYQARLGGLSVRLCLFTPEGGGVTFQENLCAAQTGGSGDIRLCMRAGSDQGGLLLQMDQHAVDVLRRVGWPIWISMCRKPIWSRIWPRCARRFPSPPASSSVWAARTRPSPSSAKTAFGGRSRNNSNRTFARFPHRLGTGVFFCFALCLFQKWGTIGVSKSAGRFIV